MALECPECRRKHEVKNEERSFPQNKYLVMQIRNKPEVQEKEPKPEDVPKCEEHGKELVLYCREEGCKVPVCPLCIANHLKHEIMDIETGMKEEIKEKMRHDFIEEVARVSTDLEDRLKQVSALKESVAEKTEKCLKDIEKKRAEINQELDNMVKEATDLEVDTKLQIDENASVINEELLLLDNMKQTLKFLKDLSHEDLMNCREAVEDVAESNNQFLAETGSYMYPVFKVMWEPDGRISRGEMTTSGLEDHPRSASLQEDVEQPMARRVTNASQLKYTGKHSRFMYLCRRLPVGDLGGARDAGHPSPNSFNFMQFLGKFGKIVCWAPLPRVGATTSGNPGSATVAYNVTTLHSLKNHLIYYTSTKILSFLH